MKLPDRSWPESRSITGALQQRLAEALRDAAMHLAAHDHRVHGLAEVVAHAIADDLDHAGLGIHLHFGHVAAIRERVLGDSRHFGGIERGRLLAGRRFLPLRGGERDDVDAAIGADDGKPAVRERDIGRRGLQHFGRRLLALVDHRVGGEQDRLAFGIEAARAAGAAAGRDGVRVALADADLLAVDAEPLRR